MKQPTRSTRKTQHGAATLLVALVILFSLTMLTFMAAKVSVTEHKISANEYRSKQAFEAAQAGIEYGIRALQNNTTAIIVDTNSDNVIDPYTPNTGHGTTGTLANSTAYSVTMSFATAFNVSPKRITLTSTGTADDGTGTRRVTQLVLATPVLVNPPPAPVVSRTNIAFSGNMSITNPETNISAMSGGTATMGGSASATVTGTAPSGCTSNGLCQNQTNLQITGDAFFNKFFGMTKTQYQQVATTVTSEADLLTQYAAGARIFWHEGNGAFKNTIGSVTSPVLLVVNGDIKMNAGADFYGLIYGIGSWDPGGGHSAIHGAAAIEDSANTNSSKMNGTPDTTYNSAIFTNLQNSNLSFAKVTGGWRDF